MDLLENTVLTHLTSASKIRLLELTTWMVNFNSAQVDLLSCYFRPYALPSGTIIHEEGVKENFFGIICHGYVDILKEDKYGNKKRLLTLGPGKSIGELSFFDRGPSSVSVIARERIIILIMDEASFDKLCVDCPVLALQITIQLLDSLSLRLRNTTGKLIDLL